MKFLEAFNYHRFSNNIYTHNVDNYELVIIFYRWDGISKIVWCIYDYWCYNRNCKNITIENNW